MDKAWAEAVIKACKADERSALFDEAIAINAIEGTPAPADPVELLSWLRGDEPEEAARFGETAHDYADFLMTEYDLYGPEGE